MIRSLFLALTFVSLLLASDQTRIGEGNARAAETGEKSPLVKTARRSLLANMRLIRNPSLRLTTLDALANPHTCVAHRKGLRELDKEAIISELVLDGLADEADAAGISGGIRAGVFPPLLNDDGSCPQLPMLLAAAPGSGFNSHHSYPGGLAVHESFNQQSAKNFAALFRRAYGRPGLIEQDVVLAAPAWHDWAKMMVFQWNADGTEFGEFNFGGHGKDGDSRTGSHHILGLAEAMARGLTPLVVIAQASAHAAPTLGNEDKVVNWLRAAAIIARIDPVAKGYLYKDSAGQLRLPPLKKLGRGVDLPGKGQTNLLFEYQIHNLSDADFVQAIPAVTTAQVLLSEVAAQFGYDPANTAVYNNRYRNVAFAQVSPEKLEMLYSNFGLGAVVEELRKLKQRGLI